MLRQIGIFWLLAIVLVPQVFAATEGQLQVDQVTQNALDIRVSESNRYLSAEVARQISASQEQLLKAVNDNNDANFKYFDERMTILMNDLKTKMIVGGIGAVLLANALIGLVYLYVTRRYSYEHFLEKRLEQVERKGGTVTQEPESKRIEEGLAQLQQTSWAPQQAEQTMSTMFGQAAASQMTDMNQWQFQPAYEGAWKRAEQPVSHVAWESRMGDAAQPDYVHPFEESQQQYRDGGYDGRY